MEKRRPGYKEAVNTLDKIEKMTNDELIKVAKDILRVISLDTKQIEDRYFNTREEFANIVMKTIMNPDYKPTKEQQEEDRATTILKYIAYIKEESKLDYNIRLLRMIK